MKLYEWKNAELATLIKEKFNIPEGEGSYKRDEEEEELEEGGLANRKGDPRQRRPEASPIREEEEEELEEDEKKPMKTDTEDADKDGKTDDEVPAFLDENKVRLAVREALKRYMSKE